MQTGLNGRVLHKIGAVLAHHRGDGRSHLVFVAMWVQNGHIDGALASDCGLNTGNIATQTIKCRLDETELFFLLF